MGATHHLHKTLTPIKLWALMVGMVISGQYFGWSYGVGLTSEVSNYFYAVILVVLFYVGLTLSCAELASFIPSSGGPSAYAQKAFGSFWGAVAGYACLIEFLFAVPAIAVSMGGYLHLLFPFLSAKWMTLCALLLVFIINSFKVEQMARIELIATFVALLGLVIFYAVGGQAVTVQSIQQLGHDVSFDGIMRVIPFAIWLFLAIEGGVMTAEETKDPQRAIIKGFVAALLTLVICTLFTVSITILLSGQSAAETDSPLPAALMQLSSSGAQVAAKLVAVLGLFGLFASLNGITLAYSRQVYALSRQKHLPRFLSYLSDNDVPLLALLVPGALVVVLAWQASMAKWLVNASVLGAMLMYLMILASLFKLRRSHGAVDRSFRVFLPLSAVSTMLAIVFLVAIIISLVCA